MEPYRYTSINILYIYVLEQINSKLSKGWQYIKTCRKTNLRTSSGKFVHVKVCQSES